MKVELEGSLKKSLLKGCLWIAESEVSLKDGGHDEASQLRKLPQPSSATRIYDEEFSKLHQL